MEIQAIIDAQQERVAKLESVRESLVKLRQEKRTRERFAAAWEEVQQLYWDFLAGHSQLLRQNASKDIVYFRENKLSVMIGIYNATKELIGRVHRDLIPESSPVDVEITCGRATSSPRPGPSAELNDAQGESEDAKKQPENLFSREWFPRVRDELNMPFSDIPLPSRGFGLRSSETEGIPYWNRGHRPRPCLPVPDIPSFDGDLRHFESFRSIFQSVYEGSDIGRAERLMMLQSKLKGDARRVVEHLGVHGENYDKAWELLERRYSNPRALVEKEIQALIDLPQIVLQDPSTIGRALDTMRSVVQNLRKAGFNCDQGVPFIPFILTRKMDVSTRREFDSLLKQPKLPVTIDEIDLFLENRYIVMSPGWEKLGGLAKVRAEEHPVAKKVETFGGRKKPHKEIPLPQNHKGEK